MVGKRDVLERVMIGLLANGHVLIEDVPGVAKTLDRSIVGRASPGSSFSRIQFTPDLIPSDLTGSAGPRGRRAPHGSRRGPLFANLVLGDEINRSPSKTQAAALEAMEERQITVDGVSHGLPRPFFLLATQNPIETEGTYPLPEAQLDRFLLRIGVGYPNARRRAGAAASAHRVERGDRGRRPAHQVADGLGDRWRPCNRRSRTVQGGARRDRLRGLDRRSDPRPTTPSMWGPALGARLALLRAARARAALAGPGTSPHRQRREVVGRSGAGSSPGASHRGLGSWACGKTDVVQNGASRAVPTPERP